MPDWNALVRERLKLAEFSQAQQEEITAELASHLADLCREYRAQGLSEDKAVARTLQEVPDWQGLAKTIHRAKGEEGIMNDRTKRLWLPGLISIVAALVLPLLLFTILTHVGVSPRSLFSGRHGVIRFYLVDLAGWALSGAAGAFLSRRFGGKRFARLASALFPIAVILAAIFEQTFQTGAPWPLLALSAWMPIMTCGQAVALLLGALPFLAGRKDADSEMSHA
jgi:hypothetical protein